MYVGVYTDAYGIKHKAEGQSAQEVRDEIRQRSDVKHFDVFHEGTLSGRITKIDHRNT